MSELPLSIGTMHFTGIGGIGMSGIAEILFELGYAVQGSDMSDMPMSDGYATRVFRLSPVKLQKISTMRPWW